VEGPTGKALIFCLPSGDNSIVIISGANYEWNYTFENWLLEFQDALQSDAILMQREIND